MRSNQTVQVPHRASDRPFRLEKGIRLAVIKETTTSLIYPRLHPFIHASPHIKFRTTGKSNVSLAEASSKLWIADQGDGTYRNLILFADYSDPDLIRVGNDFYMVASSFNYVPGISILHSKDLIDWTILNHVLDRLSYSVDDEPAHGKGAWAPSVRYHDDQLWVFFSTPDEGIFMSTTSDPAKAWSPIILVRSARGWIDPCPF